MDTIGCLIKTDLAYPTIDHASVLPRREMRRFVQPTGEEVILGFESRLGDPACDGFLRLLCDLELHWTLRLLLHDDGTRGDSITVGHIANPQSHEVASPQLAVDSQVEQGEFAATVCDLEADSDRPDLFELERGLLPRPACLCSRVRVVKLLQWSRP